MRSSSTSILIALLPSTKTRRPQWLVLLLLGSCAPDSPKRATIVAAATQLSPSPSSLASRSPADLCVTGDFDGDQRPDTVCQFLISDSTGHRFTARPDSSLTEAEQITQWYLEQGATVALTLSRPGSDTLRLGLGQGLYCLLNLGDTNHDGKDELAFVVNYSDFSRVNSCKIASLCRGKWVVQQRFGVSEEAFDDPSEQKGIRGFLEKRRGQWHYRDYVEDDVDAGQHWHRLRVRHCP